MNKETIVVAAVLALLVIYALAAVPGRAQTVVVISRADAEPPAAEPATECKEDKQVRYAITSAERDVIERVVMAEAGAEPYIGKMAVAQCILDACISEHERPAEIVKSFGYTDKRPECPEFSLATLTTAYDITEKQVEKLICNMFDAPPAKLDVRDVIDGEQLVEPMNIDVAIRGKRYKPYRTSSGVSFVEMKYLEPFTADSDDYELYERTDTEGKLYFAAKIGMYLFALIYPSIELLKNEKFITELEELCAKSKVAYDNAQ